MNVTSPGANKDAVGAKTKDNSVRDTLAHLMLRNLSEVFGERDSERRMAAIKNLYSEDALFFEAEQRFEGRQTISDAVAALQASFPAEFEFSAVVPLPAITTSGDCSGDSVLQALRPSSTGWTLRSSKMAASTRFTSSSTTRTIRGRGGKAAHAQSATAFHGACQRAADLVATERNKSMSSASKLVAFIPRTEAPESKDREIPPFAASLLSRWDARSAGDHSAQHNNRVSSTLTARESDILAMISQGLSNKHIARALEISPETVKSHVKRIF